MIDCGVWIDYGEMDLSNFRSVFKINCVIQWNYEISSDCKVLSIVGRVKSKLLVLMSQSPISIEPHREFFQNSPLTENPFSFNRPRSALDSTLSRRNPNEKCEKLEEKQEIRQTVIYVT